jgi:hypothetical protein
MNLLFIIQEAGKLGGQQAWRLRIIHPIKLPSIPASKLLKTYFSIRRPT